ncbi:MAG: hypothetical protein ACRC8G_08965 [Plesiomonas shigelloides]
MKEYLKMADVFPAELYTDDESGSLIVDDDGVVLESFSGDKVADYTLHAINSHDDLVAEVERLRGALHDAATSLETIHIRSFGEESLLDSKPQMRSFAGARAKVAREALAE